MSNISFAEAIEFVDPEHRDTIKGMVDNMPNNMNLSVRDVLNHFIPDMSLKREERLALLSLIGVDKNKFAAKLNNTQRCEILALYYKGFRRDTLAKMYGVDRRTITHIYTSHSPHYKNVRNERTGIGSEQFESKYLTDDLIGRAMSFYHEVINSDNKNNPHASAKRGLHVVQGKNCEYAHRVIISWREADEDQIIVSGWYYQDLDGDSPTLWFSVSDESMKTSMACYSAMLADITDKME